MESLFDSAVKRLQSEQVSVALLAAMADPLGS